MREGSEFGLGNVRGKFEVLEPPPPRPLWRTLADIEEEEVTWLWRPWIPLGALTVLDGRPGAGKSSLLRHLAARLSRGELPVGPGGEAGPHDSLFLSVEEDPSRVMKPRLRAENADLARIHIVDLPALDDPDAQRDLRLMITKLQARLVVVDPLEAYAGRVNLNNNSDARQGLLTPLADLARQFDCAIVLVRHLNKKTDLPASLRGGGSVGIAGASRAHLGLGRHPDRPDDLAVVAFRTSYVKEPMPTVFRFEADPRRLVRLGPEDIDVGAVMSDGERKQPARSEAQLFLLDELANGPVSIGDLTQRSNASKRTLHRAADALGVVKANGLWRLP